MDVRANSSGDNWFCLILILSPFPFSNQNSVSFCIDLTFTAKLRLYLLVFSFYSGVHQTKKKLILSTHSTWCLKNIFLSPLIWIMSFVPIILLFSSTRFQVLQRFILFTVPFLCGFLISLDWDILLMDGISAVCLSEMSIHALFGFLQSHEEINLHLCLELLQGFCTTCRIINI